MQKRAFFLTHSEIEAHFSQNSRDFIVEEIPLYEFSGAGEHLIFKIRKKNLSTWEAIEAISDQTGIRSRDIGYAGLKDKHAMTVQSLSVMAKFENRIAKLDHPDIKVLDMTRHNNKLKIGHLKGNRFFIRLKKVLPYNAKKLQNALTQIADQGMPNFFGFQRFGKDAENYKKARDILDGVARVKNRKIEKFLFNALQSHHFNNWLSKRIEISHLISSFKPSEISKELGIDQARVEMIKNSPHFFKLLDGDIMGHYPYGRVFVLEDMAKESARFVERDIVPTGMLAGHRVMMASSDAGRIEAQFFDDIPASGDRRFAWVFPEVYDSKYIEELAHFELSFYLPKSTYATTLLEELLHSELGVK